MTWISLFRPECGSATPPGSSVERRSSSIKAEGFGKGSPSAFSNHFRYRLLAEKGGWWIDTDVVCLSDRIPAVAEFYARQDADFVACGTMHFEPGHPVMLRCLEQTMKLGRAVKWGDTGPR